MIKINKSFRMSDVTELLESTNQLFSYIDFKNGHVDAKANNYLKNSFMRIQSIEIWNFRNIEHGKVIFPNCKREEIHEFKPSLLGLYGQNGSGKTSVIMAINILKDLLSGLSLSNKYESCIRHNHDKCSLSFELIQGCFGDESEQTFLSYDNKIYYSFDIIKTRNNIDGDSFEEKLHVVNEILSIKITDCFGNTMKTKQKLFDTRRSESDDKGRPFGNKARYTRIVGNDTETANRLRDAKAIAYDRSTSFIFSNNTDKALNGLDFIITGKISEDFNHLIEKEYELMDLIPEKLKNALSEIDFFNDQEDGNIENILNEYFKDYTEEQMEQLEEKYENYERLMGELDSAFKQFLVSYEKYIFFSTIYLLSEYGKHYLFTIDTTSTGLVNVNEQWPILLWSLDTKRNPHTNRVYLNMDKPSSIQEKDYSSMKASLSAVSRVLNAVVPGLSLEIVDLGKQITNNGKTTIYTFEIMSCREGNTIPLRYESDGVRRLVSILSLLIAAYNQPFFTIAIDEIDSGIFEYLLGEILKILSISAKGQIVFTSHNLRPLEVLPPKFLCFTTTNPEKKFVRLQNRGNSNFRDGYFRNIVLGTSDDSIYSPTDQFEIEMAFYEAGLERGEKYE